MKRFIFFLTILSLSAIGSSAFAKDCYNLQGPQWFQNIAGHQLQVVADRICIDDRNSNQAIISFERRMNGQQNLLVEIQARTSVNQVKRGTRLFSVYYFEQGIINAAYDKPAGVRVGFGDNAVLRFIGSEGKVSISGHGAQSIDLRLY